MDNLKRLSDDDFDIITGNDNDDNNIQIIENYRSIVFSSADKYQSDWMLKHPDDTFDYKNIPGMFNYIHSCIGYIDIDNIDLLDALWNAYISICLDLKTNPTIGIFGLLLGLDKSALSNWKLRGKNGKGVTSERRNLVTKWLSQCEDVLSHDLHNADKPSVNKIFVAKAAYGWNDTPQQQIQEQYVEAKQALELPVYDD